MRGTWSRIPTPGRHFDTLVLLTNCSVLCHHVDSAAWSRLSPNDRGSYGAGTLTPVPAMTTPRRQFATAVLNSGAVLVLGGHDPRTGAALRDGEIYRPGADRWQPIPPVPADRPPIGTAPCCVLVDGWVLVGFEASTVTALLPTRDTDPHDAWIFVDTVNPIGDPARQQHAKYDACVRQTWTLFPAQDVTETGQGPELVYSLSYATMLEADRTPFFTGPVYEYFYPPDPFHPDAFTWRADVPSQFLGCPLLEHLVPPNGLPGPGVAIPHDETYAPEYGPAEYFLIGANGHTVRVPVGHHDWLVGGPPAIFPGPALPDANRALVWGSKPGFATAAYPCCLLPTGQVLCAASYIAASGARRLPGVVQRHLSFYELAFTNQLECPDPSAESSETAWDAAGAVGASVTRVDPPPDLLPGILASAGTRAAMTLLPTGAVLFANGAEELGLYTPILERSIDDRWRPEVTMAPAEVQIDRAGGFIRPPIEWRDGALAEYRERWGRATPIPPPITPWSTSRISSPRGKGPGTRTAGPSTSPPARSGRWVIPGPGPVPSRS